MSAQLEILNYDSDDDGTDGDGAGDYTEGSHTVENADDESMSFTVSGTISPATAQTVDLDIVVEADDGNADLDSESESVTSDADTGAFTFPSIGTDDIPDTGVIVTFTVSTTGVDDSVIEIEFTNAP